MPTIPLPTELWLLIFARAVFDVSPPGRVENIVNTLLAITAVDRTWRELAIEDSILWTKICVPHSDPHARAVHISPAQFDRIATFLGRSKSAPLRLWLTRVEIPASLEKDEIVAIDDEWKRLVNLLKPHMNRCRKLWVHNTASNYSNSTMLPSLSPLFQPFEFPYLEEFFFSSPTPLGSDRGVIDHSWNVCPVRTPLKSLRFTDWDHYLPPSFDVAWPYLTSLDLSLHHSRWPRLCRTLAKLPFLQKLQLRLRIETNIDLSADSSLSISSSRVVLPNLTTMSTNYLPAWLDISTPRLSKLSLGTLFLYDPSLESGMVAKSSEFLWSMAELGTSVRELKFGSTSVPPQIVIPILQELRKIDTLIFNECNSFQSLISHLAATRAATSSFTSAASVGTPEDVEFHSVPAMNSSLLTLGSKVSAQGSVRFLPALRDLRFTGKPAGCSSVRPLVDSLIVSSPDIRVHWDN
ncbi:hypothetical protein DL93DRAFT_1093969 [Clavulina sp. PMI_390]|nr:hypothetical protein DL93DRAFT_1093969 [Clavulina sp. PMI_390]